MFPAPTACLLLTVTPCRGWVGVRHTAPPLTSELLCRDLALVEIRAESFFCGDTVSRDLSGLLSNN